MILEDANMVLKDFLHYDLIVFCVAMYPIACWSKAYALCTAARGAQPQSPNKICTPSFVNADVVLWINVNEQQT
jgi:hypothetical protein